MIESFDQNWKYMNSRALTWI